MSVSAAAVRLGHGPILPTVSLDSSHGRTGHGPYCLPPSDWLHPKLIPLMRVGHAYMEPSQGQPRNFNNSSKVQIVRRNRNFVFHCFHRSLQGENDAAVTMSLLYLLFSTTFCPRLSSTKRTNDVQANLVFFMALIKYEVFNLHAGSDGIRHSTCTPWYFPTLTPHGAPAPALREEFQSQLSPDFAVTMSAAARKHIDLMLSKHGRST